MLEISATGVRTIMPEAVMNMTSSASFTSETPITRPLRPLVRMLITP